MTQIVLATLLFQDQQDASKVIIIIIIIINIKDDPFCLQSYNCSRQRFFGLPVVLLPC